MAKKQGRGERLQIYLSADDAVLWNYAVALLGRDRVRHYFINFFLKNFLNAKMQAEATPERQAEAKERLKRKAVNHETA